MDFKLALFLELFLVKCGTVKFKPDVVSILNISTLSGFDGEQLRVEIFVGRFAHHSIDDDHEMSERFVARALRAVHVDVGEAVQVVLDLA